MAQHAHAAMKYLQADTNARVLTIYCKERDWADFESTKHLEYYAATALLFGDNSFAVHVHCNDTPPLALLHCIFFKRLLETTSFKHSKQVTRIALHHSNKVSKMLCLFLAPLMHRSGLPAIEVISSLNKKEE